MSEEQKNTVKPLDGTPEALIADMRAELANLKAAKAEFDQAKTDAEYIKSTKTEIEQVKAVLHETRGAVEADTKAISETKNDFLALKRQTQTQGTQLTTQLENLTSQIQAVEKERDQLQTLLNETKQIKTSSEEIKNSVAADIQNIGEAKTAFEGLRTEAQTIYSDLQGRQTETQNKIVEINTIHSKTKELFDELLDDERDADNNIISESLGRQIKNLHSEILEELDGIKNDRAEAKLSISKQEKDLIAEIRSLLPEAGAAGLSGAYVQAKARYGGIPYSSDKTWFYKCVGWIFYQAGTRLANLTYYLMFVAPLIAMIVLFHQVFKDLQGLLSDGKTINETVLLLRVSLTVPLGIISLFGWSSIRLNRRLYEEYNHKQRVMQLYHSFKKEIEQEGTTEHKQALLAIMLKTVDDKPSLTMHKYDKGLEDMWSALSLGGIFSFFKKDEGTSS